MDSMPRAVVLVEKWLAIRMTNLVIIEMGSVNTSQIVNDSFWMFGMRSKMTAMVTRVYDVDRMRLDDDVDQSMM